jgi:thymidylate kinase
VIREILTARDRYLTYVKARRYANNGGLVLTDRFPIPGIQLMDGPQVERMTRNHPSTRFLRLLDRLEKQYYQRIQLPEVFVVLKATPEIAVERKVDEEADSVFARSKEIWDFDWDPTPALVVDANQAKTQVLSVLKKLIWTNI